MSSRHFRERCSCLPGVFQEKPPVSLTCTTMVAKHELALQRSAKPSSFEATNARGSAKVSAETAGGPGSFGTATAGIGARYFFNEWS